MALGEKTASITSKKADNIGSCSFSDVVDKACEGLMDRQVKNSIRRIREMESRLCSLEQELDAFLLQKDGELT